MNVFTISFSKHGFEVASFAKIYSKSRTSLFLMYVCTALRKSRVKTDSKRMSLFKWLKPLKKGHCHLKRDICLESVFLHDLTMIITIKVLILWIVNTLNCIGCVAGIDKLTL